MASQDIVNEIDGSLLSSVNAQEKRPQKCKYLFAGAAVLALLAGSATAFYFVKNTAGEMPVATVEDYKTKLNALFGSVPTCGADDSSIPVIDVWQTQKPMSVDHFQTWWTKLSRPELLIDPS